MFGTDFPVSETHGRAVTLGDSFHWIYDHDLPAPVADQAALIGIESLLALKQACQALHLNDSDVQRIFRDNARDLLGICALPDSQSGSAQVLYRQAKQLIPGGTQLVSKRPEQYAPDKWPAYYREARGCEVIDLDGRRYLDFATSGIGSCLLGYSHPSVTAAVLRRVQLGSMCTLNSPEEVELAKLLLSVHPWAQRLRLARSGGEALSVAVRIARAGTRRDVIAFCGYHGWSDWYLAANLGDSDALSGHLLSGLNPAGVPQSLRGTALPFTYNRIDELREIAKSHGARLAAVVMEPTRSTEPLNNFLQDVRQICDDTQARLIFDEVTTGFRLHRGGAHLGLGVTPDMAVYAKALGNGHPIAAIIGSAAAMDAAQDSFISSTYWTEGVGPAAAVATLSEMLRVDVPAHVRRVGTQMRDGLSAIAKSTGLSLKLSGYPALTFLTFDQPQADALMTLFTVRMLGSGFLAAGGFYPTLAHDDKAVQAYLRAAEPVFEELAQAVKTGDVLQRIEGKVRHSGFRRLN
jgi:glutamate-1-semialdehyde 2,1-aminomutase